MGASVSASPHFPELSPLRPKAVRSSLGGEGPGSVLRLPARPFSGRPAEALLPRSDPRRVAARYCYPGSFSFAVPLARLRVPPDSSGKWERLSAFASASRFFHRLALPSASAASDPFEPRPPAASGSAPELLPLPVDPLPGTNGECHRQPSRATEISLWITRITGIISMAFCLCQSERRRLPVIPGMVLSRRLARLAQSRERACGLTCARASRKPLLTRADPRKVHRIAWCWAARNARADPPATFGRSPPRGTRDRAAPAAKGRRPSPTHCGHSA